MKGLRDLYKIIIHIPPPPGNDITLAKPHSQPIQDYLLKLEFFAKVDRANGKRLLRVDEENERHAKLPCADADQGFSPGRGVRPECFRQIYSEKEHDYEIFGELLRG